MSVYPWQQTLWQRLTERQQQQRLPHAVLLSGSVGVGKQHFARQFAQYVLCQQPQAQTSCGRCKSCLLWQAGSHPDFVGIEPETDSKTGKTSRVIKIDQIRDVVTFLTKSSQLGGWRVVLIQPADSLNVQAANSLLKTLEEPGAKTLLLLLTDQPLALLPTIRSRCQHFPVVLPKRAEAQQWLSAQLTQKGLAADAALLLLLSEGAPLAALALAESPWLALRKELAQALLAVVQQRQTPLATAQTWHKQKPDEVFMWLAQVLSDVIVLQMTVTGAIKNSDLLPIIKQLAELIPSIKLMQLHSLCLENQRLVSANVQPALLMDAFWQQLRG